MSYPLLIAPPGLHDIDVSCIDRYRSIGMYISIYIYTHLYCSIYMDRKLYIDTAKHVLPTAHCTTWLARHRRTTST